MTPTKPPNVIADVASLPTIDSALILHRGDRCVQLEVSYSLRNYEGDREASKQQFESLVTIDLNKHKVEFVGPSNPIDAEYRKFKAYSPSRKYMLLGVKGKKATRNVEDNGDKFTNNNQLHVFKDGVLQKTIAVDEIHGDFNTDPHFGIIAWNEALGLVCYGAEGRRQKDTDKDGKAYHHHSFQYTKSWGEALSTCINPKLFLLDLCSFNVQPVPTPKSFAPSAPVILDPHGDIVYVGYEVEPVKLGLHYCYNRPNRLIRWNRREGSTEMLSTSDLKSYRSLKYTDGRLWLLQSNVGGSHFGAADLCSIDSDHDWSCIPSKELQIHRKEVFTERIEAKGKFVYFNEPVRSKRVSRLFHTVTNSIVEIGPMLGSDSSTLLDVDEGEGRTLLVYKESSPVKPHTLSIMVKDGEGTHYFALQGLFAALPASLEYLHRSSYEIVQTETFSEVITMRPATPNGDLILIPHGGPNSVYPTEFNIYTTNFLALGYTVAVVNYTGSIGFGAAGIASLEGRIGERDVEDMMDAIGAIEAKHGKFGRLFLFGGSHGGFMSAILTGLHPKLFAGCVMRNPVIDLPSMSYATDIVDWTFGQLGIPFDLRHPRPATLKDLQLQYEHSPSKILESVITPTLLLIGEKDMRVPPFQGKAWYTWLKAKGVPVALLSFPDAGHSLDTPVAEKLSLLAINDFLQSPTG